MCARLSTYLYLRPRLSLALLLGPPLLWLGVAYLGALFALLVQSFFGLDHFTGQVVRRLTLATYGELFTRSNFDIVLRTAGMAAAVTLAAAVLAFPLAYYMTFRATPRTRGWLYLAIVLDLFSRRVVGWATSDRLKRDLAVEALRRALVARNPAPGLVHHSDRGSQYCSVDYQALLRKRGILISMSGRGNCYDNSMVETFFKTIKSELIWPVAWQSRQQAENAVARYIDGFYNPVRRHSSLGFQSPIAFERKAREVS